MSRFRLMTSSKKSNLFLIEWMFKCLTISLLGEFSFISFRAIWASLIPSRKVGCLSLWFSESVEIFSEPSAYFPILDLVSFVVFLIRWIFRPINHHLEFLGLLSFSKNYWCLVRNCSLENFYLNDSSVDRLCKDASFLYLSYQ